MTDTARRASGRLSALVRGLGELLITAGLVILLFAAYVLWGTGAHTSRAQASAEDRLESRWQRAAATPDQAAADPGLLPPELIDPAADEPTVSSPSGGSDSAQLSAAASRPAGPAPSPPAASAPRNIPIGAGLARLLIPRFGSSYQWVVGEGVTRGNLRDGPGHYPGSAFPGQVGNFVLSGHRTTYGAPFSRLAELQVGDAIVVETARTWYTYRVRSHEVVDPQTVSVTYPVPHHAGAAPTERLMTMTTCHPKFTAKQRLIFYSVLESKLAKSDGARPAALGAS